MKSLRIVLAMLVMVSAGASFSGAADLNIFGPVKYDVKERYGKPNAYSGTFAAAEGAYLIKLQSGEKLNERSEYIELTVNGEKVLRDGKYGHRFFSGFLSLRKENTIEVVLKDEKPSGFRRPVLPPRFVTITVMPVPASMKKMQGIFGLNAWEDLAKFSEAVLKLKNPEAQSLAMAAASLRNDTAVRADAMRKLSDLKDASARDFLLGLYLDVNCVQDVRGEAALALGVLGDKTFIPVLMTGVIDPEEKVSVGSARALSFYREEDTQEQLMKMLERLDAMRLDSVINAIVNAGWKPVGTIIKLAESSDPHIAATATKLLGGMQDPRATDLLLKFLAEPGQRDMTVIISALGATKDPRAVEALLKIAGDPERRKGRQAELGEALAALGDQRAAEPIAEMIRKADSRASWERLRASYKKLTGKDHKQ
jgi:HEAT repeat protein